VFGARLDHQTPPIIYVASFLLDFVDRSVITSLYMSDLFHLVNLLLHSDSDPIPSEGSNDRFNILTIRGLIECG
jgi:hypothetical protein